MSRAGKLAGVMGAFGASLLLSSAAFADVLEISGGSSIWVARGASGSRPNEVDKGLANPSQTPVKPSRLRLLALRNGRRISLVSPFATI